MYDFRNTLGAAAVTLIVAGVAQAQDDTAAPTAQDAVTDLQSIVVTARKREESLLDIPLAVTAQSAAEIEAKGITSLGDIALATPGFALSNGVTQRHDRSAQTLFVRGMVPATSSGSGVSGTSVYIDGAPLLTGFVEGIADLERVEVMKGPQSAYFGRAAFAGAVNLVTKDPGDEFGGSMSALFASYDHTDVRLSLEGPIIDDKLSFRVSARGFQTDGHYRNSFNQESLGDQSTVSLATTLLYRPTDNLKAKLYLLGWEDDDGATSVAKYRAIDYNCNAGRAPAGQLNYLCGTLPILPDSRIGTSLDLNSIVAGEFFDNASSYYDKMFSSFQDGAGLKRRAFHGNLNVSYEFPGSGMTLSSVTAGDSERRETVQDSMQEDVSALAGTYPVVQAGLPTYPHLMTLSQQEAKDFSQELRLTGPQDQRLNWMVGVNYFATDSFSHTYGAINGRYVTFNAAAPVETETLGVFGAVSYDITPSLTATFEARLQEDDVSISDRNGTKLRDASYDAFMPRAMLSYTFPADRMVYVSAAQAVNPGGFNTSLFTATPAQVAAVVAATGAGYTFDQEEITNFEIGYKGRFWNNRGQLTVALYKAKWTDQIVTDYVPVQDPADPSSLAIFRPFTNVGETDLQGIEIEATLRPLPELTLQAQLGVNQTDIRNYPCAACFTSLTGSLDVRGNELPNVPETKGGLSAEWREFLGNETEWYGRVEYFYSDGVYVDPSNLVSTPSSNLYNLRLGFERDQVGIEAFVLNATDEDAPRSVSYINDFARASANAISAALPLKRQYGVRMSYRF